MNLIILVLIAFITTIITFATCGAGGGLMMLVALNGFSEIGRDAHSNFLRADGDRHQLNTLDSRKLAIHKSPPC